MRDLKSVSLRMPDELLKMLDAWCKQNNVSRSSAINYLLTLKLRDEGYQLVLNDDVNK